MSWHGMAWHKIRENESQDHDGDLTKRGAISYSY